MADEAETEPEGEDAPKGKSKKKLIMIAGAAVLLLGGGGAFFLLGGEPEAELTPAQVAAAAEADAAEVAEGTLSALAYFGLPNMLVNLSSDGARQIFLRMEATLELSSASDVSAARERSKAIVDGFQTFLREMRPNDIAGSGGIVRLKEELVVRANDAIGKNVVRNVFLTEFLVQ